MAKRNSSSRNNLMARVRRHTPLIRGVVTFSFIALGILGVYTLLSHFNKASYALSAANYTCQSNGTFVNGHIGAAALTSNDTQAAAKAMEWIEAQTHTKTIVTTDSTLEPDTEYANSYTGAIDGSFTLSGASYAIKNDAPLTITSPSTVSNSYSGVIEGHVLTTPEMWRWIIQVYKKTAGGYVQVPKQALADGTTGEFTIDLSDIVNPPAGEWAFGILDANNSYAPHGVQWPQPNYYDGLEVQQKLVTDNIYDWSTTRAYTNGSFHFDNSNTGKKLYRLVDTASGDILAEYVKPTGLIRSYELNQSDPSYETAFEERSFVYDQAVALFAAIGTNNEALATTLVDGLLQLQQTNTPHQGAFVFASSQLTPEYRDALVRTGAHAIATDALLAYLEKYPSASNISSYTTHAEQALSFLQTTLSSTGTTSGLYTGGFGDYSGVGNSFNANSVISWASTEHNIDIWHALTRAARVFKNAPENYAARASALESNIQSKLYNASEQRYNQGMTTSGADTANPLDVNSWGAIQQYASGKADQAVTSLSKLAPFKFTQSGVTGYAAFYDSPGYPNANANVWFEGTYGVALAQLRVGDVNGYRTTINEAASAQANDGSFTYVTTEDLNYELYPRKSVASTAWYILATTGSDAIWNYCTYAPPTDESTNTPSLPSAPTKPTPKPNNSSHASTTNDETPVNEIVQDANDLNSAPSKPTDPTHSNAAKDNEPISENVSSIPWVPIVGSVAGIGIVTAGIVFAVRRNRNGL